MRTRCRAVWLGRTESASVRLAFPHGSTSRPKMLRLGRDDATRGSPSHTARLLVRRGPVTPSQSAENDFGACNPTLGEWHRPSSCDHATALRRHRRARRQTSGDMKLSLTDVLQLWSLEAYVFIPCISFLRPTRPQLRRLSLRASPLATAPLPHAGLLLPAGLPPASSSRVTTGGSSFFVEALLTT